MEPQAFNPFFRNPMSDILPMFESTDIQTSGKPFCRRLEMKYFDCLQAYGIEKGYQKCSDILDDFFECRYETKQSERAQAIQKEYIKQYKEGKRPTKYREAPELESYDNLGHNNG